ncbi:MAG: hypothetical protein P4L87_03225 [Formivibrio sp.]|nr:hypothetical protein [Formivibrio sp.]
MGKKSREKRERRLCRIVKEAFSPITDRLTNPQDKEFVAMRVDLETLFSQFNAEDACMALCVSHLWLPNISSLAKHAFAFWTIASMTPDRFTEARRIQTYQDFHDFAQQVCALLPEFGMLEDFVPEPDWGEIRFEFRGSFFRCFFGGAVERIPDFVTAFLMLQEQASPARDDMHAVLSLQDHVISHVDRSVNGSAEDIENGHIEVPEAPFWEACQKALLLASALPAVRAIDAGLVVQLGQVSPPTTRAAFSGAMYSGSAIPFVLLEVGKLRLPTLLRDAPAAVIEHWNKRNTDKAAPARIATSSIGQFLGQRFRMAIVVPGPLRLSSPKGTFPHVFAGTMAGGGASYLIIALAEEDMKRLPAVEKALNAVVSSGQWSLDMDGGPQGIQLRGKDGTVPATNDVRLIAVLARVSTSNGTLGLPKTSARVMPLPDFVTILDSIEDCTELEQFWTFDDTNVLRGPYGLVDRFAAFRDTHALLVDGAVTPDLIAIDPLWGGGWRYRQLEEFWRNAPPLFPYGTSASWQPEHDEGRLFRLENKQTDTISWCATVGQSVVHVVMTIERGIEMEDARILEMAAHCIADSLAQRNDVIAALPLFARRRITTILHADPDALTSFKSETDPDTGPLFSDWDCSATTPREVRCHVSVNLHRTQQSLNNAVDASFEVEMMLAWIDGLNSALKIEDIPHESRQAIQATKQKLPRFVVKEFARHIDVPQYGKPALPSEEHYKLARRDLAVVFKDIGAQEGTYELDTAKELIKAARLKFRDLVHQRVAAFGRDALLVFCIEQLDILYSMHDMKVSRIKISRSHEVNYDRSDTLAEAQSDFLKDARNYRYLLECCASMPYTVNEEVTERGVVSLMATVDWLFVLYTASDMLHYGIDAAGLRIDHGFVPEVFYAKGKDERESAFKKEMADLTLEKAVKPEDTVREEAVDGHAWKPLDTAFAKQHGFELSDYLAALLALASWPSVTGSTELAWSYGATREQLRDALVEEVIGLDAAKADAVISLAILDPKGIRRLLGRDVDEDDVPVWEQNKRGDRYTIKPLVAMQDGLLRWGAAASERAMRAWAGQIGNGYLPADYKWPRVREAVRAIKERIEMDLEAKANLIVSRGAPHIAPNIDFMRKFPDEGFEDVGDFDVMAYWPGKNLWLVVECKYNQRFYCIKDMRRLRERIFGIDGDRGQFAKIERRRTFLEQNVDKIRTLLKWPKPAEGVPMQIKEVYASRDIYWWMRNPPYEVSAEFVRIDVLDHWLREAGLLVGDAGE